MRRYAQPDPDRLGGEYRVVGGVSRMHSGALSDRVKSQLR
jgi:hypothetical protein